MCADNFTTTFLVDQNPTEVFDAIANVRGWWSGNIEGVTDLLGAQFTYRYRDIHYSKQEITEFVPAQRVTWQIVDSSLNFTSDPNEWTGTEIEFEISDRNGQTEVRFTHQGIVPEITCFKDCSDAWSYYVNDSLRPLITSGQGLPNNE
jgi:hypothetical protein